MFISGIAFTLLNYLNYCKKEYVDNKQKDTKLCDDGKSNGCEMEKLCEISEKDNTTENGNVTQGLVDSNRKNIADPENQRRCQR